MRDSGQAAISWFFRGIDFHLTFERLMHITLGVLGPMPRPAFTTPRSKPGAVLGSWNFNKNHFSDRKRS